LLNFSAKAIPRGTNRVLSFSSLVYITLERTRLPKHSKSLSMSRAAEV